MYLFSDFFFKPLPRYVSFMFQCLKGTKRPNMKHVIHFDIHIENKKILFYSSIISILISQHHDNILFLGANVITTATTSTTTLESRKIFSE